MATLQLADRVKETSTTTGLGTFTLLGAVVGFRSFATFSDADTVYYVIEAVDGSGVPTGQWEVGIGTIGATGTTLARTALISSSTGGAINFAAGTKNVFCDQPSSAILTVAAAAAAYQPLGSYAAASHTHTASQVTDLATAAVAFTNKTGAISQWTNDAGYLTSAGSGDVVGPASSVDNAIARFDGTTGKLLQGYTSGAPTVGDTGAMTFTPSTGETPINITALSGTRLLDLTAASTGNAVPFSIGAYNKHIFASGGLGNEAYINDVVSWGFNTGTTIGTRSVAGKASLYQTFEQKFFDGTRYVSEWHLEFLPATGTSKRLLTVAVPHVDGATGSGLASQVDTMTWSDWAGTSRVQWNLGSNNVSFLASFSQFFEVNNTAVMNQRNAADSSYVTLPYIDSDDRLRAASPMVVLGATPTTGSYPNIFVAIAPASLPVNGEALSLTLPAVAGDAYAVNAAGSFTGTLVARLYNSSNTSGANACLELDVRTAGGDPFVRFYDSGSLAWAIGMDRSDAGKLKITDWSPSGSTERLVLTTAGDLSFLGHFTLSDAKNIVLNATTGTKIGTATTQKLGFYNATPVVQGASVADATDAASALTQLNALISRVEALGLIATV